MLQLSWNPKAISEAFAVRARMAHDYLNECRSKVAQRPAYQFLIDEHSATYFAHDYFVDRSFLATPEALVAEARAIRDREWTPTGIYDAERYRRCWRAEIDRIIDQYTPDLASH